jgi:hypothetical protein
MLLLDNGERFGSIEEDANDETFCMFLREI